MSSRWLWSGLCLLAALFPQPSVVADEPKGRILFLHLRIEQDGSVHVLSSRTAPGKLKTPRQPRGALKLELQSADSSPLWNGAVEDPRVRHFEVEEPPGSGNLERRTHTVAEAEFMVRIPAQKAAAKVLIFEQEALKGNAHGRAQRKVLLSHPLPPAEQVP